jgi:hypothetical protein
MEAMSFAFHSGNCPEHGPSLNSLQGLHGIAWGDFVVSRRYDLMKNRKLAVRVRSRAGEDN